MDDELLTVKEVAARLKVNPQTVRRWIRSGRLPAVRIGTRGHRVRATELRRLTNKPPELTPDRLERQRKAIDRLMQIRESMPKYADGSLQDLLDEEAFEMETGDETISDPPPLTSEQIAEQKAAMDALRLLRPRFSRPGPSLQELLDERRRELED
jgi:excisionase family DNA binding protein